jgi:hypothetical protein
MDWNLILEIVGYIATGLILISFCVTSIRKLRWLNTVGSFIAGAYALLIKSYPVAVTNFAVVAINIYYLVRMAHKQELFIALPTRLDSKYLQRFVLFFGRDMQKFFPHFVLAEDTDADVALFVHCDMTTAGLLIGKNMGEGILRADLDYSTPAFRDLRVAKYLYAHLKQDGFTKVTVARATPAHSEYLHKMGFVKNGEGFEKVL